QRKMGLFNFVWHDLTSFKPYQVETSFEDSLLMKMTGDRGMGQAGLGRVQYVLRSLPENAKRLFKVLVEHQIEQMKQRSDLTECGLSYRDLFQACQDRFYVTSEPI